MKKLNDILNKVDVLEIKGNEDITVNNVVFDSRMARKNDLFVAVKGTRADGHDFIPMVIEKQVSCIVCEYFPEERSRDVSYVKVKDSAKSLGLIASNFYGNPSRKLKLVGITGTNGKTTIATLLYKLFTRLGYKAGLFSTIRNYVNDKALDATHTTPDPVQLNRLLDEMQSAGCEYAFMEVSSHAVSQQRISGLVFSGGIFTNLTHDHLDYHHTFADYIKAKKQFFDDLPKDAFALINADDNNGRVMVQNCRAQVHGYALKSGTRFTAKIVESHFEGMMLNIGGTEMWTTLIGEFNAYNILAVYACALLFGQDREEVMKAISVLETVSGRFEYVRSNNGIIAVIDYAHTPDALNNVLSTINQIKPGNRELITVVGAGGNRDKDKRPMMAKVAVENSNKVIITSDNPRDEDPEVIIEDMIHGVEVPYKQKVLTITNRGEAIKTACMMAGEGDIILIAGKGHETYQEIRGIRHHFSDKEEVSKAFMLNNLNLQ